MSQRRQVIAISTASLLSGVIATLTVLLPVTAGEFTFRNVIWGGAAVGLATMMTSFFKAVIRREADREETLGFSGYVKELAQSLPVLIFPAAAITIGSIGLAAEIPADTLIDGLFYSAFAVVCTAAFTSSYLVHQNLSGASLRALVWAAICVCLLVMKKLA